MSRVGKQPVEIPSGVKVAIAGNTVTVEGPKGKLSHKLPAFIAVKQEENTIVVSPEVKSKQAQANYGTARSLINNMVLGVTQGWTRSLQLNGVGFTAKLNGDKLTLATGYSHDVTVVVPQGVEAKVQKTSVQLTSCDKQQVGQVAATLRQICPPEPYLGKGVKYVEETVRRKAGKTGK